MGVRLSAAGSLQWYRDSLTPEMSFEDLLKEAESIPPGATGYSSCLT
jgi:xylulokinase